MEVEFRMSRDQSFKKWQALEHQDEFGPRHNPYACHLIPKGWREWANNDNNFLAATWKFHQELDGLNVVPTGIPTLLVEFVRDSDSRELAEDGWRHKVEVRVRFRTEELANEMKEGFFRMKPGSVVDGSTIRTHVHVKDPIDFKTCLDVKRSLTKNIWARNK